MSTIGRLLKDYVESRNGRISWLPNVYLFLDMAVKKKRLLNWKHEPWPAQVDADTNREYALFRGRAARCPHPDKWLSEYPRFKHSKTQQPYFLVSAKSCQGCIFHEPAKRYGLKRYASCRYDRETNQMPSPLALLNKATNDALEILK